MNISRSILIVGGVLVCLASSAPVSDWLCERVESRYPPLALTDVPQADAIVVLGGGITATVPPRVIPQLTTGGSRVWYGARLWKAGKAPKIVVSGGSRYGIPEAAAMAEFLSDLGVDQSAVLQERASRNTVENALFVKPLLIEHGFRRVLLVTSSLHMPRALAIFNAAGIDVIPAAGDVEVGAERDYYWREILPNADALYRTSRVMHEVVGYLGYRVQFLLRSPPPQTGSDA